MEVHADHAGLRKAEERVGAPERRGEAVRDALRPSAGRGVELGDPTEAPRGFTARTRRRALATGSLPVGSEQRLPPPVPGNAAGPAAVQRIRVLLEERAPLPTWSRMAGACTCQAFVAKPPTASAGQSGVRTRVQRGEIRVELGEVLR